ncbi:MAG: cupin domain-containing protein [Rhodobacterales bacterium]|nr:cupin domain-containing protein [Rhodobacterales bacterium]
MSNDALARFLGELARLVAQEDRPEAQATADALRHGPAVLPGPQAPCSHDAEIRRLAATPGGTEAARLLLAAQDRIPWGVNPVVHLDSTALANSRAVAALVGPDGPIRSDDLLFGLFYQQPQSYYPLHDHEADETYMILAGSVTWTAGEDCRLRHPGEAIHHPRRMPHAFRTGPEGFLAFWRWSGDIRAETYRMLPDPDA